MTDLACSFSNLSRYIQKPSMRAITLLLVFSSIVSCTSQVESNPIESRDEIFANTPTEPDPSIIDTVKLGINFTPEGTYNNTKQSIRNAVARGESSGEDLENYIINQIIPFWYGTPWDFNGYTAIPNEGEIACGYFVSTTLLHAGLNINRYHLAQQAGLNEAKSLAITDDNYETIYGIENLEKALKDRYTDGLYFVGLDSHVGYLYIKHGEYYFIHSNYIDDKVMIQKAMTAEAFQSNIYVIANITTNEELLKKWRNREVVKVIRE
jgi:hypothetical protein